MTKQRIGHLVIALLALSFAFFMLAESFEPNIHHEFTKETATKEYEGSFTTHLEDQYWVGELPDKVSNPSCQPLYIQTVLHKNVDYGSIVFYTIQSSVKVWLDDNLIYDYSKADHSVLNINPASKYHIIEIPEKAQNVLLKVEIQPFYPSTAGDVPTFYYGKSADIILEIIRLFIPTGICCGVLMTVLILTLVYSFASKFAEKNEKKRIRAFSFLFIAVACWCLLETPLKQFMFRNYLIATMLLEMSFYSIPIFLSQFFMTFKEIQKGKTSKIVDLLTYLQFVFVQIMMLMGVPHIEFNWLMQISTALVFINSLFYSFRAPKCSDIWDFTRSLNLLAVGFLLEIIKFIFISRSNSGAFILVFSIAFVINYSYSFVQTATMRYIQAEKEKQAIKVNLEKAQTQLMIAQIRPHFLYNTLTSIQTIIKVDPDYAYDLLFDFSRYLRSSINSLTSDALISFTDEIKNVESYLHIEKMRMGNLLSIEYDFKVKNFNIVPLSVQPIVENSIKHGTGKERKKINIMISSYETEDSIVITIKDDGVGFDSSRPIETDRSVGITNIRYRLEEQMKATLTIDSTLGKGTTTIIRIPRPEPLLTKEKSLFEFK